MNFCILGYRGESWAVKWKDKCRFGGGALDESSESFSTPRYAPGAEQEVKSMAFC